MIMAEMKKGDDPGDFGVSEVNEYLKTADADERERVLQAEADGKDRSTVKAPAEDGDTASGDGDGGDGGDAGTSDLDSVQAAGVEVQTPDVTSETTNGPVPPGEGAAEESDDAESEEFEEPETHDEGEAAAVKRTMAKKVGGSVDDEGSE